MKGFERINHNIYYLNPVEKAFGGGITFVTGKNNFLIDCGASDSVVSECLVPALKDIGYNIKNIDYILFTHCHPENMGGAHKLRSILSGTARFMAYGKQADKLKNPTYYLAKTCNIYPDHDLPFREVKGILADGLANEENIIFSELYPIATPGHDDDCVCWYHIESKTLISGDAIQGNGTKITGIAYYNDLKSYKSTLKDLSSNLEISTIICSDKYFNNSCIIKDTEKCTEALQFSYTCTEEYQHFVDSYIKGNKIKRDSIKVDALAESYFENKEKPECLAYSMITFSQHI